MRVDKGYALIVAAVASAASCSLVVGNKLSSDRFEGAGGRSSSSSGTSSATGAGGGDAGPDVVVDAGDVDGGRAAWVVGLGAGAGNTLTVAGMGVDGTGNIYVTGSFQGTVPLKGLCTTALMAPTLTTMAYVIKLDPDGTCLWAMSIGGTAGVAAGTAISVRPTGDFAIALTYTKATTGVGLPMLPNPHGIDAVVVKYLAGFEPTSATSSWFQHFGDMGDQVVTNVVLDPNGGVYAAGSYTTGLVTLPATALNENGTTSRVGFAVLLNNTDGTPHVNQLLLVTGAPGNVDIQGLGYTSATDGGTVAVAGRADGSVNFGNGPTTPAGSDDAFFGQYGSASLTFESGAWLAAPGNQEMHHADFNAAGDLYVSGSFTGAIDFASSMSLKSTLPAAFLAHVNSQGLAQEAIAFGTVDPVSPLPGVTFAVDAASGDVAFAGTLRGKVDVGGSSVTTQAGVDNIVVGRLDASLATAWWLRAYGSATPQGADAVAFGSQGVIVAGHFLGTLAIPGVKSVPSSGGNDIFIAQLDP